MHRLETRLEKLEAISKPSTRPIYLHTYPGRSEGDARVDYETVHGPIPPEAAVCIVAHAIRPISVGHREAGSAQT
jgi:hypothetical protein